MAGHTPRFGARSSRRGRRDADVGGMTLRPILALAATAALALPAAALAGDGPSTQSGPAHPPPCGAAGARSEGQPSPCSVRICNDGQASTARVPCPAPCAPDVKPTREAPCAPVPAQQQQPQPPAPAATPAHGDDNGK